MTMQEFANVSLRFDRIAQEDTGSLTIGGDSIQFHGRRERLSITNIHFVSIGGPSGGRIRDWVKVEYGQGLEPVALYLREKGLSGGAGRIYSAMQHFPNSRQFECRFRVSEKLPILARLNPLLALRADLKKGHVASTSTRTVTLSPQNRRAQHVIGEIALSEVEGFSCEMLTAKQQVISELLDVLRWGVVGALIIGGISVTQLRGADALSLPGFVALALGIGTAIALLGSIHNLLEIRTLDLFTLKFKDGTQWQLGVFRQQSESVVQTLESFGIERAA
jgi:hypothetical protein